MEVLARTALTIPNIWTTSLALGTSGQAQTCTCSGGANHVHVLSALKYQSGSPSPREWLFSCRDRAAHRRPSVLPACGQKTQRGSTGRRRVTRITTSVKQEDCVQRLQASVLWEGRSSQQQRCSLTLTLAMRAGQRVVGDARKRGELPSNVVFHLKLARRSFLPPNRSLHTTHKSMHDQLDHGSTACCCMTASCQGLFAVHKSRARHGGNQLVR